MDTYVVYDSVFGNTEKLAKAVAEAAGAKAVRVLEVRLEALHDTKLLIAASPTRAFKPTPAMTEWLQGLPEGAMKGVRVAALDTRIRVEEIKPRLLRAMAKRFGYAADPMLKLLVKKGGTQAAPPQGFYVCESEGPLKEGEAQRAADWAKTLIK